MSNNSDLCFDNIIGLSRTDCDCFTDGMPAGADISDSGLYLDELEGLNLNMISGQNDCDGLWDILEKAKSDAITTIKADLLSCISANTTMRRKPFSGVAGEYFDANMIINKKAYAAAVMQFASVAGGYIRIKRIGTKFDTTGTINVGMYSMHDDITLLTMSLDTEAGKIKWNNVDITIDDLSMVNGVNRRYYFTYQSAYKPYNTASSCGCGTGKPIWSSVNPCYSFMQNSSYGWASFMMLGGGTGDSLSTINAWNLSKETYGLVFDIEIGCKSEKTICKDVFDFQSDPYAITIAHAVRFKAGELVMMHIRSKANPNYYSLVIPEMMEELQSRYRTEYENRIYNYLCPELSSAQNLNRYSDCFTCKDSYGFQLAGIWK